MSPAFIQAARAELAAQHAYREALAQQLAAEWQGLATYERAKDDSAKARAALRQARRATDQTRDPHRIPLLPVLRAWQLRRELQGAP